MIELLYSLDLSLFQFVNSSLGTPFLDPLFIAVTMREPLLVAGIVAAIAIIWKKRRAGLIAMVVLFLTAGITDRVSSGLIKPLVERERPCRTMEVRQVVSCGSGKSFPSSHAANIFAAAVIASYFFRRSRPYVFSYAALVALSRVYCGVHYPSDIIGGAVIGSAIAVVVISVYRPLAERYTLLAYSRISSPKIE